MVNARILNILFKRNFNGVLFKLHFKLIMAKFRKVKYIVIAYIRILLPKLIRNYLGFLMIFRGWTNWRRS